MKRLILSIVLAIACVSAASAEMKQYYSSGGWSNAYGTNDGGKRMCSVSRVLRQTNANEFRMVMVKYSEGSNEIFVHVAKSSWNIPTDSKVTVSVGFDGQFWSGTNDGRGNNRTSFYVNIKNDSTAVFLRKAAEANIMNIAFGGNEPQWNVSMDGSRNTFTAFAKCVTSLAQSQATQPYGNAATTQPHNSSQSSLPEPTR